MAAHLPSRTSADKSFDVIGIGNAIVDVLARVDDRFIDAHGLTKGIMRLCDGDEAEKLYADMGPGTEKSGGSAANTMVGIASFGGRAAFVGKVRDDQLGEVFAHDIRAAGVEFATGMAAATTDAPTARSLILVTPDAQRTMNTSLGVAGLLTTQDVPLDLVRAAKAVYLEGYLWEEPLAKEAIRQTIDAARAAETLVAFSLSDAFCVERNRAEFAELVAGSVDVLFANEAEITSLFEVDSFDDSVERVRQSACRVVALTRGARGSVVLTNDGGVHEIDAIPTDVVDTTGAGDLYAAGVLYGLTTGRDPGTCGRLGSLAAAEVISHLGARPERSLAELAELAGPAGPAEAAG